MTKPLRDRGQHGRLLSGHPKLPGAGRPKGARNKKTLTMLELMQRVAEQRGGDEGVKGFADQVAKMDPVFFFAQLVRGLVPPAKEPEPGEGSGGVVTVNILPIATGKFIVKRPDGIEILVSQAEAEAMREQRAPGTTIEHAPLAVEFDAEPERTWPAEDVEPESDAPSINGNGTRIIRSASLGKRRKPPVIIDSEPAPRPEPEIVALIEKALRPKLVDDKPYDDPDEAA